MHSLRVSVFVFLLFVALVAARPQKVDDYDYKFYLDSTEDPGVAIDKVPVTPKSKHHHHHHHHNKNYIKTNRLGKLRKYFEEHYL